MKIIEHGQNLNCERCSCEIEIPTEFTCEHCGCKFEAEFDDYFTLKNTDSTMIHAVCPDCGEVVSKVLVEVPEGFKVNEKVIFTMDNTVGVVIGKHAENPNVYLVEFLASDDPKRGKALLLNQKFLRPFDEGCQNSSAEDSFTDSSPYNAIPDDYNLKDLLAAALDEAAEVTENVREKLMDSVSPEKIEQLKTKVTESAHKGKETLEKLHSMLNSRPAFHEGDRVKTKETPNKSSRYGIIWKTYNANAGIYSVWLEGENKPSLTTSDLLEFDQAVADESVPGRSNEHAQTKVCIDVENECIPGIVTSSANKSISKLSLFFRSSVLQDAVLNNLFPIPVLVTVPDKQMQTPGIIISCTGHNEYMLMCRTLYRQSD